MIGFGIDESVLTESIIFIEKYLIEYKIPYENVEDKHITISQITDKIGKDELVRIVNSITPNFKFIIKDIVILHGRDNDFIALELSKTNEYQELFNTIKERYSVVEFDGGQIPHISLFKIPAGIASKDFLYDVFEETEIIKTIKTTAVELWNTMFQKEYKKE